MSRNRRRPSKQQLGRILTMNQGKVFSQRQLQDNTISTNLQLVHSIIFTLLLKLLHPSPLSLIVICVTLLFDEDYEAYPIGMYFALFMMTYLIMNVKEIYFNHIRSKADTAVNSRKFIQESTKIYRNGEEIKCQCWGDVKEGDIIFLEKGEIAPADLVILDTHHIQDRQAVVYTQTKILNGKMRVTRNRACELTEVRQSNGIKLNWQKYKKQLSGQINYEKPNSQMDSFEGIMKMKKDPANMVVSIQNFIHRQTTVKTCWIYGLVVYAGMNCKIMKQIQEQDTKSKFLNNKLDKIFIVFLVIALGIGLIYGLLYFYFSKPTFTMFVYHLMLFTLLLPHFLYVGRPILLLYFSLSNDFQKIFAQIVNYDSISKLGDIDFAVVSYNSALNSGNQILDEIITASSVYDCEDFFLTSNTQNGTKQRKRRLGSSSVEANKNNYSNKFMSVVNTQNQQILHGQDSYFLADDISQTNNKLNFGYMPQNRFRMQLEPLKIDKQNFMKNISSKEEESFELIRAFSLCHQAKLKKIGSFEQQFESNSKVVSQEVLHKILGNMNVYIEYKLSRKTKEQENIKLKVLGKESNIVKEQYYQRKINVFHTPRKIFSVLVKSIYHDQFYIYCKGTPDDMIDRIKDKQLKKNLLQNKISQYKNRMNETIIYGKRKISEEEFQEYQKEFNKLKITGAQVQDIEDFSTKYENDLEFICMVGLGTEKNQESKGFIDYMTDQGVKLCILANSFNEIKEVKQLLDERDQNVKYVQLNVESEEQIKYNLNNLIRALKKEENALYSIIVGKNTWQLLENDSTLKQHFLFALYYSHSLIAYGLFPQDKVELTHLLKTSYNREHTIIAIGSSFSDGLYFSRSDISVVVSKEFEGCGIPSDIRINNIGSLKNVIQMGNWVSKAYDSIMNATIYRVILITSVAFTFETILLFVNGVSLNLNGYLVFIYTIVYGLIETLILILVNHNQKHHQKSQKKQKQQDIQLKDKKSQLKFVSNIIESAIHGIIIVVSAILILPNVRLHDGKLLTKESMDFSFFLVMMLVSIFRHIFAKKMKKMYIFITFVVSVALIAASLGIGVAFQPLFKRIAIQPKFLFTNYDSMVMIINTTIFCLCISLFINNLLNSSIYLSGLIYKKSSVKSKLKTAEDNLKLKLPMNITRKDINIADMVKHLFKEEQNVEESVQQLLGQEFDLNQLKIGIMQEIRQTIQRIKHQYNNAPLNIVRLKYVLVVFLLFLIIQLILDLQLNHNITQSIPLIACITFLVVVLVMVFIKGDTLNRKIYSISQISLIVMCLILFSYQTLQIKTDKHFLLSCLVCLILTQLLQIRLGVVITCLGLTLIPSIVYIGISPQVRSYFKIIEIFYLIACAIFNFFILGNTIRDSRRNFLLKEQMEMQNNQTKDVYTILVPQFVRNIFIDKKKTQYKENSVAILFAYVCDFDNMIEEEQKNVVKILDDVYRQFDRLCTINDVQKIQTVGYTYMAATGIKQFEKNLPYQSKIKNNKVERLFNMAVQMMQRSKSFKWGIKKNKQLKIKIGIHVGEAVVGVIGQHKKQFSLVGTTINTTSRHGSTGATQEIVLSQKAIEELQRSYKPENFTINHVYMKGLCKTKEDTIPVYVFKYETGKKSEKKPTFLRARFKDLINMVIRSIRCEEPDKTQIFSKILQNEKMKQEISEVEENQNKTSKIGQRHATLKILQRNQDQFEKMKNREDYLKDYNNFLEFEPEKQNLSGSTEKKQQDNNQNEDPHTTDMQLVRNKEDLSKESQKDKEKQNKNKNKEELDQNMQYLKHLSDNRGYVDQIMVILVFIINFVFLLISIFEIEAPTANIVLQVFGVIFITIIFVAVKYSHKKAWVPWLIMAVFLYFILVENINFLSYQDEQILSIHYFYGIILITFFSNLSGIRFFHTLIFACLIVILQVTFTPIRQKFDNGVINLLFYTLLILIRKYELQKEKTINFRQQKQLKHISTELEKVVSELLPKHAFERLKNQSFKNRFELTDVFQNCTLLFADIKGFTEFSDRKQNIKNPQNVVKMLKQLFQSFDLLCKQYQVYKVYTIGDCYVVLGFINCFQRNPQRQANNVVKFGLNMLQIIENVKQYNPSFGCLNMRIGVHTGKVIGGIVGTDIVRYDIYGKDVVVANKFEQTGIIGQIHLSEKTKELLDKFGNKPYNDDLQSQDRVQIKKLKVSYDGYFIKKGNLS